MSESKKVLYDLKDVKEVFGSDIEDFCSVEFVDGACIMKPLRFLGSDVWRDINQNVQNCGGRWIKAGKESHWTIPLETKGPTAENVASYEVTEALATIRRMCDILESCMD